MARIERYWLYTDHEGPCKRLATFTSDFREVVADPSVLPERAFFTAGG